MARHQPQTGALGLGGEERAEQALQRGLVHADAFIAHADAHLLVALRIAAVLGHQTQLAAVGHGLDRIECQVQQHLLQLGVIGVHRHPVIGHFKVQFHIAWQAALEQHADRLEQPLQHDALTALAGAAHERQHRIHHLMTATAALGDHVSQPRDLGIDAAVADQVRHDQQRLQDIAQVVAQPSRQQRQAFQPLRAHQLIFHAQPFDLAACFADGAHHGRRQARRQVLDDVVVGAFLQRVHRRLFTHRAGDEDEGNARVHLTQDAQRLVARKPRHAQVRQHDVRHPLGQRAVHARLVVHAFKAGLQPGFEQLIGDQLRVFGRILHQQNPQGPQHCIPVRHGAYSVSGD
ncbi:hypothetical protein D3C71_910490 [compost metagenome]